MNFTRAADYPSRTVTPDDEAPRIRLLEEQIGELLARVSKMESVPNLTSTKSTPKRRDSPNSDRSRSTSSGGSSRSDSSLSTPNELHSPVPSPLPSPLQSVSLPFALKFSVLNSKHRDPTPDRTKSLWQHYVKNIDPLLKIFHLPTVQQLFIHGEYGPQDVPQDSRALKWAICYAAATSQELSRSYSSTNACGSLSKVYQHSLETSLAKARFLANPTIPTVQALTLYLTIGAKVLDPTYIWSLTAILVRLAIKLKLHRDPDSQNIPFRDGEYRRRLWWHICTLDASTAEANSTDPLIYERQMNTAFPAAIQDDQINSLPSIISKHPHPPDMFYSHLRFEITYYTRTILYSDTFAEENGFPILSLDGRLSIVDALQRTLEENYYRVCTCRSPLCTLAMLSSKIYVANLILKLRARYAATTTTAKAAEQILLACTNVMEASCALRADPMLEGWAWLWQGDVSTEFDAAATCLETLAESCRARSVVTTRAWSAIDGFFNAWAKEGGSLQEGQWARLEGLRQKAVQARGSTESSPLGRHEGKTRRKTVVVPAKKNTAAAVEREPENSDERQTTSTHTASVAEMERVFRPCLRCPVEGLNKYNVKVLDVMV